MGAERCGIVPVWASEIEPFPIRVTTKHFPYMLHYGDVSTLDGAKLPPVDIITFGSPCQDMSIAGKRAGLCGSRSNLFYEAIRIIKEMRLKTNGIYPRIIVWENVYGICSKNSNSMKSNNPHSGIYKADTARTLDLNGGNPSCNQGGMAIVDIDKDEPIVCVQDSLIGRNNKNGPQGNGVSEGVSFTLNTIDRHAVAYTQKAYDKYEEDNLSCSLKASGGNYGGGSETIVCDRKYIVRRLTPTECGRLQGFPDGWCKNLETETPTEKDIAFWREVFETHRKIVGQSKKPKTDKQIIKWLKNPYSDTAEYKMWGNGVALPNVEFVLSRIAECIEGES